MTKKRLIPVLWVQNCLSTFSKHRLGIYAHHLIKNIFPGNILQVKDKLLNQSDSAFYAELLESIVIYVMQFHETLKLLNCL